MNNRLAIVISGLAVTGMLLLSLWAWQHIPDTQLIPVHYGLDGTADRYGSKVEGLLSGPVIAVGVLLLFIVLPKIDPRQQNLARSEKAYAATWLGVITFLMAIHTAIVLQALGWGINAGSVITVGLGVLLTVIGNYLGKVRSNFSFGIRTPWTLSSEQSWNKTHRLGGRLFFLWGIGCILFSFIENSILLFVLILGGAIAISLVVVFYSYWVWKNDSEKQNLG